MADLKTAKTPQLLEGKTIALIVEKDSAEVPTLAGGPVSHGLTAEFHPMQGLAELMIMREFTHRHLSDTSFCILGDTGGNLGSSQRMGAALQACCRTLAETSDARITLTGKLANGVEGCDFVSADVWVSMGEPEELRAGCIALQAPFAVTQKVMDLIRNRRAKVLHRLPAFHNRDTVAGGKVFQTYGLECMEATGAVFATIGAEKRIAALARDLTTIVAHGNGRQLGLMALQAVA